MIEFEQWAVQWEEQRRARLAAAQANQKSVFDALTALGIERVEVSFDGYGDSGQIEDVTVVGGAGSLTGRVAVVDTAVSGQVSPEPCSLPKALGNLCYDLLEHEHAGWENNDGAFGVFVFDIAKRSIELEFSARYTSHDTSVHTYEEV